MSFFTAIFGDPNDKYIKKLQPIIAQIRQLGPKYEQMTEEELRALSLVWRKELSQGQTLADLLPEVFAATREAAKRAMGSGHFDVQLIGAMVLHEGMIAEMKTGEGKTSYAVSPAAVLNSLTGEGVHVVTVNDYLSKRDAGWIGGVYEILGLSVGAIVHDRAYVYDSQFINAEEKDDKTLHLRPVSRREAYQCDITYGTNNEFGFDYLRDNMAAEFIEKVQRGHAFAIVDEVDSILIDEARTPLIISAPAEEATDKYKIFANLMPRLKEGEDYNIDEKMRAATLTEEGVKKMEQWLGIENIYTEAGISEVHHMEQALRAQTLFQRDRDYVIKDGEIIIVDEFTGRLMYGRRYSEGLHQAIEAKEGVAIKQESVTMATITFQNYFRMYKKLAGMTGTAATEAEEFFKIYQLEVITVPTNKAVIRKDQEDFIYKTEAAKFKAVIKDIKERSEKGQPVLVGTISIEKNELFSHLLTKEGIKHNILNAKNHEREAQIIAEAGEKGAVTLATNMAGRGVDIVLGGINGNIGSRDEIIRLGGLYVIGTERHEARRIDNQLRGRAGRQGDPGESRFYVSLEDELMRIFGSEKIQSIMSTLGLPDDQAIEHPFISKSLSAAQKKVEGHNFDIRKHLVEYDDVINKHREVIYRKRNQILEIYEKLKSSKYENPKEAQQLTDKVNVKDKEDIKDNQNSNLKDIVLEMVDNEIEQVVSFHTTSDDEKEWNIDEIYEVVDTIFSLPLEVRLKMDDIHKTAGDKVADIQARHKLISYLIDLAHKSYEKLEQRINSLADSDLVSIIPICAVEKMILLKAIDMLWVEHIDAMDRLRTGIGLRGYGQRDPLVEYKREAYEMFIVLQNNIQKQVAYAIYKVGVAPINKNQNLISKTQALRYIGAAKEGQEIGKRGNESASFAEIKEIKNNMSNTLPAKIGAVSMSFIQAAPVEAKKEKIGRNDPCPCGSGKKYKRCCGA